LPEPVIVCGSSDTEARLAAYVEILGPERVSALEVTDVRPEEGLIVDIRGKMDEKRSVADWINSGAFVISDALPASDLSTSRELLSSQHLLLAQPSRYDPRHRVLQQQLIGGQIGELVAMRWVSLWPDDCWLPEGALENYAFDMLDSAVNLMGVPKRVMARQQRLKREVPDTLFVTMVAENGGAIGYLEISCCQPPGRRVERIEVVGRTGMLEYDSDANRTLRLSTENGTVLREAFWESPLRSMVGDYVLAIEDQKHLADRVSQMIRAFSVLERTAESVRTGRHC